MVDQRRGLTRFAAAGLVGPLAAVGLLVAPAHARADAPQVSRLFLMESAAGFDYWSSDRSDPELPVTTITRTCPSASVPDGGPPCASSVDATTGSVNATVDFLPDVVFSGLPSWDAAHPLSFHLALTVTPPPLAVKVAVAHDSLSFTSAPATQTSPGVYDGTITTPGSFAATDQNPTFIAVLIQGTSPALTLSLGVHGQSWLDLASPLPGYSSSQLLAGTAYHPDPGEFKTAQRDLTFNDGDWEAHSFSGNLGSAQAYTVALTRPAAFVYAWTEMFVSPYYYDVENNVTPLDQNKRTDAAVLTLSKDGSQLAHGYDGPNGADRGMETVASVDVAPGTLTLNVAPTSSATARAYNAYVVIVYGQRTLASLELYFTMGQYVLSRTPEVASCGDPIEQVPTTAAVQTFSVHMNPFGGGGPSPRWTINQDFPHSVEPCGLGADGLDVRITEPFDGVWRYSAVPAAESSFVSNQDAYFQLQFTFTYQPLGPAAAVPDVKSTLVVPLAALVMTGLAVRRRRRPHDHP